ncbi:MAG: chromosome segregation protein SMC [Deltaproteobacteria bacterium]|nr:chromosome segregation protein SMC [Candidatus Tharpella aukensis]
MKILNLRFKNLNSLVGEWSIDFTTPEYVGDGIFAITGPTGAGKSTILDAICLALYGRTPRLKLISKNSNEIMSRQTGECFAEVTFATQAGQFRAHWSQHRARKKSDGNLAESKHEISELKSGRILESKKRNVAAAIEKKTGMDFDRFTRSMLLAQGGFAAFLQAAPDARAPILEQITGTEIYSKISQLIHERKQNEQGKLEILRAETGGIAILSDEGETALKQELIEQQKAEKNLWTKNEGLKKSIARLNDIAALKSELLAIDQEAEALKNGLKAFAPDREILLKALKATELESEYATLSSKREEQKNELQLLTNLKIQLPDRERALGAKETAFNKTEEALLKVKNEQKNELELIKKVREFDLQILAKQSALKSADKDHRKLEAQLYEKKEQCQKYVINQKTAIKKLADAADYLLRNADDAALISDLTGINEQLKNLKSVNENISTINNQVTKLKKQAAADNTRHKKQQALGQNLKNRHDAAKKLVIQTDLAIAEHLDNRHLREYRAEHDALLREMAYLKKIASLEDEREKLEDHKPCPLCGSLHHPYTQGNSPKINETEKKINQLSSLIQKAEELETNLQQHNLAEKKAGLALAEAEKQLIQAGHKRDESQANLQHFKKELQTTTKKQAELKKNLLSELTPFGITKIPDDDLSTISSGLGIRLKRWQTEQKRKTEIENQNLELAAEIKSLETIMHTLNDSLKEKQKNLDENRRVFATLTTERKGLYGQKNPDTEELRLTGQIFAAEKSKDVERKNRDQARQQLSDLKTRITTLNENISKREPELTKLEPSFRTSCKKSGFEDEPTFLLYRLSPEKRDKLGQQAKALDNKQTEIKTRKNDREIKLVQEIEKKTNQSPLEDLQKEQMAKQESLKELGEEIGAKKQKLYDNKTAKSKHQEQQLLIEKQKKECTRWDSLHLLIGSADGKKYRNFAQGLTFALMVSHANQQLEKMSDRYLLVRDQKQPLELNVIDNYQASEIRSTKNLSGGESFIVSLSLALGLSKMASQNVRVDSLFLDEGFGTLDEEALDTALETLAGLQQDGKLIGVISHVSALKERISTRISIQPLSGGKSTIIGPGCKRQSENN